MASPKAYVKRRKARRRSNKYISAFINVLFLCSAIILAGKLIGAEEKSKKIHFTYNATYTHTR